MLQRNIFAEIGNHARASFLFRSVRGPRIGETPTTPGETPFQVQILEPRSSFPIMVRGPGFEDLYLHRTPLVPIVLLAPTWSPNHRQRNFSIAESFSPKFQRSSLRAYEGQARGFGVRYDRSGKKERRVTGPTLRSGYPFVEDTGPRTPILVPHHGCGIRSGRGSRPSHEVVRVGNHRSWFRIKEARFGTHVRIRFLLAGPQARTQKLGRFTRRRE